MWMIFVFRTHGLEMKEYSNLVDYDKNHICCCLQERRLQECGSDLGIHKSVTSEVEEYDFLESSIGGEN